MAISAVLGVLVISSTTVALSVAVAMWIAPLTTAMSNVQSVKLNGAWVCRNDEESFTIFVGIKNDGGTPVTIMDVLINKVPFKETDGSTQITVVSDKGSCLLNPDVPKTYLALGPGCKGQMRVQLPDGAFAAGQVVTLEIETLSGIQYLTTMNLL